MIDNLTIQSVERQEKNWVKIIISVGADTFNEYYEKAVSYHPCKKLEEGGEEHLKNMAVGRILERSVADVLKEVGVEPMNQVEVKPEQVELGKELILSIRVIDRPPVKLGQYKGIVISKEEELKITDEDIEAVYADVLNSVVKSEKVERPAQMGDETVIDFKGMIDDVAFDGGTAEYYSLTLGSHSFIPGFEEQIVGHAAGDEFDVNVAFPESYRSKELAGKPAVFKCKLHQVQVRPQIEYTEEFIKTHTEFPSQADFREYVGNLLLDQKRRIVEANWQNMAIAKAADNAEFEINEEIIESHINMLVARFENQLASQGMKMDEYMQQTGTTMEKIREDLRMQAENLVKNDLVLNAVAQAEGLVCTDEDVEAFIKQMAEAYNIDEEKARNLMNDKVKKGLVQDKAGKIIMESAILQ